MSAINVLLVDDSEAILAFEKAALSSDYSIVTANDGRDALEKAAAVRPSAIQLDLSMPVMDGDEVLARLQADPDLMRIPVIVVSTEKQRADACLRNGAKAFLPKPIRADELRVLVGRVLEEVRKERRQGNLAVLGLGAGTIELAVPLDSVVIVIDQPATLPLPTGPHYLSEYIDLRGRPICVLDLAARLGVEHSSKLSERKLVVVRVESLELALCADWVRDPEEIAAADIVRHSHLGGTEHGPLSKTLIGIIRTQRGQIPVLAPSALLSREQLRGLPSVLRQLDLGTATA